MLIRCRSPMNPIRIHCESFMNPMWIQHESILNPAWIQYESSMHLMGEYAMNPCTISQLHMGPLWIQCESMCESMILALVIWIHYESNKNPCESDAHPLWIQYESTVNPVWIHYESNMNPLWIQYESNMYLIGNHYQFSLDEFIQWESRWTNL